LLANNIHGSLLIIIIIIEKNMIAYIFNLLRIKIKYIDFGVPDEGYPYPV
jgi:hypothetical protein